MSAPLLPELIAKDSLYLKYNSKTAKGKNVHSRRLTTHISGSITHRTPCALLRCLNFGHLPVTIYANLINLSNSKVGIHKSDPGYPFFALLFSVFSPLLSALPCPALTRREHLWDRPKRRRRSDTATPKEEVRYLQNKWEISNCQVGVLCFRP